MKQGTKNFNETLARGLAFEQGKAIEVLHLVFPDHYIMNNQIDPSVTTGDKVVGPRLYRGENRNNEVIAPDFVMFDESGGATWVDAKLKGASYPYKGREYFTIDRYKHKSYCKFPPFMLDRFFLLFKHEKTGDCYLTLFRPETDTVYFDNQYGKGDTPVYFLDKLTKLSIDK